MKTLVNFLLNIIILQLLRIEYRVYQFYICETRKSAQKWIPTHFKASIKFHISMVCRTIHINIWISIHINFSGYIVWLFHASFLWHLASNSWLFYSQWKRNYFLHEMLFIHYILNVLHSKCSSTSWQFKL